MTVRKRTTAKHCEHTRGAIQSRKRDSSTSPITWEHSIDSRKRLSLRPEHSGIGRVCRKCGNEHVPDFHLVCDECYAKDKNLPTMVTSSDWVRIISAREKEMLIADVNRELRDLILSSYYEDKIVPNPQKGVVVVRDELPIQVNEAAIDAIAKKSGLLGGKWLIYVPKETVDHMWKLIARSTLRGELGVDAKVSTASEIPADGKHVICVYTKNYLDLEDVKRLRDKPRELGFTQRLYYKPDIYTYLRIYRNTFPGIRASRYSE